MLVDGLMADTEAEDVSGRLMAGKDAAVTTEQEDVGGRMTADKGEAGEALDKGVTKQMSEGKKDDKTEDPKNKL